MQAVSRKVEGTEPRNSQPRKDHVFVLAEVNMVTPARARDDHFLGVEDHGMHDRVIIRQPGRPWTCFRLGSMPNNRKKGGGQNRYRESDRLVVPMKAGNAAGGKEMTGDRAE